MRREKNHVVLLGQRKAAVNDVLEQLEKERLVWLEPAAVLLHDLALVGEDRQPALLDELQKDVARVRRPRKPAKALEGGGGAFPTWVDMFLRTRPAHFLMEDSDSSLTIIDRRATPPWSRSPVETPRSEIFSDCADDDVIATSLTNMPQGGTSLGPMRQAETSKSSKSPKASSGQHAISNPRQTLLERSKRFDRLSRRRAGAGCTIRCRRFVGGTLWAPALWSRPSGTRPSARSSRSDPPLVG